MKKLVTGIVGMLLLALLIPISSNANGPVTTDDHGPRTAGLAFANVQDGSSDVFSAGLGLGSELDAWKRRRRRKKKRTFAVGVVVGNPAGLGGRAILRIKNFGIAGDIAYNRVRSDSGPLVDALVTKIDARFYRPGLLGKLLRVYVFGGATMQSGRWDEVNFDTAVQIDVGIGGGIKLWRLSINGEVGMLIPAVKPVNYDPGFGVFANLAVMVWLF